MTGPRAGRAPGAGAGAPGAGFGETRANVIVPDVIVEEIDTRYEVRLERSTTPRLRLSMAYREFLKNRHKNR